MTEDIRWIQRFSNFDKAFSQLMKIETELDDLLLPYKIDLSKLSDISNADLLEHIKRIGVVFFER